MRDLRFGQILGVLAVKTGQFDGGMIGAAENLCSL